MKLAAAIALMFLSAVAQAAGPFVVSDVLTPGVTNCGMFLDATAKVTIPVTPVTVPVPGVICKYDLGPLNLASGPHSITATAILVDPIFGTKESAQAIPLAFNVPGTPTVPGNLKLSVQ